MVELLRTDDVVLVTWLQARLAEAGIECVVFDAFTSAVYGGALDAVVRRMMVAEEDLSAARRILAEGRALAGDG